MITTSPKMTDAGKSLMIRALAGEAITLTGFKIGDGTAPANPDALVDLVHPMLSFGISGINTDTPGQIIVRGTFDNTSVLTAFQVKEFGLFAQGEAIKTVTSDATDTIILTEKPQAINSVTVNDAAVTVSSYTPSTGVLVLASAPAAGSTVKIRYPDGTNLLFAYENEGANASIIQPYASDVSISETVILYLEVSSEAQITAYLTPDAAYVLKSDYEEHLTAQNPHGVTKGEVGLGNVPNVSTNDQKPTWSLSSTLTELVSGEKLSAAFGKIARAVRDFILHIANRDNPHNVTTAQIGAAAANHTHGAADISGVAAANHTHSAADISGVVGINRGGTGISASTLISLHQIMSGIHVGSYTGNNADGRTISLGFTPRVVIIYCPSLRMFDQELHVMTGGIAFTGINAMFPKNYMTGYTASELSTINANTAVAIVSGGFRVFQHAAMYINTDDVIYSYIAIE